VKRRDFLSILGVSALPTLLPTTWGEESPDRPVLDKIEGCWFEFQHPSFTETKYWNADLLLFTAEQWEDKIREIAACGMRYLVLFDVAAYDQTFYPSELRPQFRLGCDDPLETVLTAADKHDLMFFVANDFFGNWRDSLEMMSDDDVHRLRVKAMHELVSKYGRHKSFYGWYYPNETGIREHYEDLYIHYVNRCSAEARKLTPQGKILIAPYGTRNISFDDRYLDQLHRLDVDYIAYQDEVGVQKTQVEELPAIFENLRKIHEKAGRSKLWADVEIFAFSGEAYTSNPGPAPSERVIKQLEAVAPFVEKILIYEYIGLLNRPGSKSFAGNPESTQLYQDLLKSKWIEEC